MKVLISQSNYLPWKGYFDAINSADIFVLYDDMQYTKRDWRNRNKIKTPEGTKWITIPVIVKGKYDQKINETLVENESWKNKHLKMIYHNYSKAPFFEEIYEILENIYTNLKSNLISDINHSTLNGICKYLGIKTKFLDSSNFEIIGEKSTKLLNICKDLKATEYISGPAAKSYLDIELFRENGINVIWMNYEDYPYYHQLHGEFDHNVSILDLLFMNGKQSVQYLKSFEINY